ncbi:T9SS type A sorting domain-containing protein [Chryseobacterium sp. SIMBA_029]|uniref:T9SS type A sorting domain-containing protein n=1 Tax=Chryseobacterium sp. SIMBA_029 TaxID=3085772 RepID=UPI003979784F
MKKIYLMALSLFSALAMSQQTISFEAQEGFTTADIHGQGTWISTPTGGMPPNVTHQIINTEKASTGSYSLKIVKEPVYGTQSIPIIGGFNNLTTPLTYTNFIVSFDINMSQLNGSVFGFQGVNSTQEQFVIRVDFDNSGGVKILNTVAGNVMLDSTTSNWVPNSWYRFKVVGSAANIKYFVNDTLIYTGAAVNELNIDQVRFVHNNNIGTAYIDNIKIDNETLLSTKSTSVNGSILVIYPNPSTDFIKINSSNTIRNVEVFDLAGKRINLKVNNNMLNIRDLSSGLYLVNIETEGRNFTKKFIKK